MSQPTSAQIRQQDATLIQIVNDAFADSAKRSGTHLVCHPGCTQCCHGAFAINALDAQRLRDGMATLVTANPSKAQDVTNRAKAYLAEFSPTFPGNPKTGILGTSEEAQTAFEDFANEAPCPALDPQTGLCELYDSRPMTCRVFGPPVRMQFEQIQLEGSPLEEPCTDEPEAAYSVCELCFTEATPEEIAAAEMQVPHAEEEVLLTKLQQSQPQSQPGEETIIAYCLTNSLTDPPQY